MSFTRTYYEAIRDSCQQSANAIVPRVYDHVQPKNVVDVGGGEGWWAYEFAKFGCDTVVYDETVGEGNAHGSGGTDGHITFRYADLERDYALGEFDLALCLEVAEHISPEAGNRLVPILCGTAPVILWSAAIPGQKGLGHINEQPHAFWHWRFGQCGYLPNYSLWPMIDNDERVAWWYRQNIVLYERAR